MADDIRSDIIINVDTSVGIAEIKNLQRQISQLNAQLLQSGARQARAAQDIQANLVKNINATGKFAANIKTISTTAESFTAALEKNKLSMGEYFRYAGASTKTFGSLFKNEFDTINKVARERVKTLQTQYVKLGRDANGALKAIAVRPLALDMDNLATRTALAAQKQQLFNQLLKQGSTNLLNFGKNTQWAGRQLMVGFTLPLAMMGSAAVREFKKIEQQAIRFKRVYGDAFDTEGATEEALSNMKALANEFTKYGIEVEKTLGLAADAAQMGLKGADLRAQVTEATRLAVLGEVEQQEALKTTISVTNAFGISAEDLAKKINFLNAVENETVTAINDLTIAIPKAGPVVKQLGGSVEDLAFLLTAMKEGGINASEGANALKSGLASLINPSEKSAKMLAELGININAIVESNAGNVRDTVISFAKALDTLDPLNRARAIEQLFGKFQFSRISTLFQNVTKEGNQASRVLRLASASAEELAIISERELRRVEDSPLFKFQKQVEKLQAALAPIGEEFLKAITPVIEFGAEILKKFNEMGDGAKQFAVVAATVVGGIGPLFLMMFGLIANGAANIIKLFANIMRVFTGAGKGSRDLGLSTEYMTQQQLEAAAVAASLNQTHSKLIQTFTAEAGAVDKLAMAYGRAVVQQSRLLGINPETGAPITGGRRARAPRRLAKGIVSVPGPKGAGDIVPAMLSPGEAVIPAKQSAKYAGLIQGMINDDVPGYRSGRNPFAGLVNKLKPEGTKYGILEGILRMMTGTRTGSYDNSTYMYRDAVAKKFLRSNPKVAVRMPADKLIQMAQSKDKRYKSVFETGFSQAGDTVAGRTLAEQKLFNLPLDADPRLRPVYGYLFKEERGLSRRAIKKPDGSFKPTSLSQRIFESLTGKKVPLGTSLSSEKRLMAGNTGSLLNPKTYMYGNVAMELKKRSIKDRTTFTYGDSYNSWASKYATPAPLGTRSAKKIKAAYTSRDKSFFEAQILGGFTLKDVKRIITTEPALIPQLQAVLKANGLNIPVRMPRFTIMQRLQKLVYGKRAIADRLPFTAKYGPKAGKYTNPPIKVGNRKLWLSRGAVKTPKVKIPKIKVPNESQARGRSFVFPQDLVVESAHMSGGTSILNRKQTIKLFERQLDSADRNGLLKKFGMNKDAIRLDFENWMNSKKNKNRKQFALFSNMVEPTLKELNQKFSKSTNRVEASFVKSSLENSPSGMFGSGIKSRLPQGHGIPNNVLDKYGKDLSDELIKKVSLLGNKKIVEKDLHKIYREAERVATSKIKNIAHRQYITDLNTLSRYLLTPAFPNSGSDSGKTRAPIESLFGSVQKKVSAATRTSFPQFLTKNSIGMPEEIRKLARDYEARLSKSDKLDFYRKLINESDKSGVKDYSKVIEDHKAGIKTPAKAPAVPASQKPPRKDIPNNIFSMKKILARGAGIAGLASIFGLMFGENNVLKAANGVFSVPGPKGAGDIVPAMLSPGESVIPAKQSQKYAPLVSAMINDSVPGYRLGKQDNPAQQMANAEAMRKLGLSYNAKGQLIDAETKRFISKSRQQEFDNLRTNKELLKEQKQLLKQERANKIATRGSAVGMVAGMAAMGYSASGGPGADIASMAAMPLMFLGPLLPMLMNPVVLATVAIGALAVAAFALNEQFKKNVKEAYNLQMSTGASTESLEKFAEFSGNVTAGQIMDKRRQEGLQLFQIQDQDLGFGTAYLASESGKALKEGFGKAMSQLGREGAIANLTNQMSVAVASGALNAGQARDIVAALGAELNDYPLSININSKLISLLGEDGENLLDQPLTIRAKIIEESRAGLSFNNIAPNIDPAVPPQLNPFGPSGPGKTKYNTTGEGYTTTGSTRFESPRMGPPQKELPSQGLDPAQIGLFIARSVMALQIQQEMVDSLDIQYEQLIANAKAKKDFVKVAELEAQYEKDRAKLLSENAKTVKKIQDTFNQAPNKNSILEQYKQLTAEKFKEDPIRKALIEGFETSLSNLEDEKEVVIRSYLLSGDLDATTIDKLLNGEDSEKQINLLIKLGAAGYTQAQNIASLFGDETVEVTEATTRRKSRRTSTKKQVSAQDEFNRRLEGMSQETATAFMNSFLPVIQAFGGLGEKVLAGALANFLENPELLEEVNEQVDELKKKTEGKPVTLKIIQEVYGQEMVDKIKQNQAYFDSLPDDQKITYTTILRMIGEMDPLAKRIAAINYVMGGEGAKKFKELYGTTYKEMLGNQGKYIGKFGGRDAVSLAEEVFSTFYAEGRTTPKKPDTTSTTTTTGNDILEQSKKIIDALKKEIDAINKKAAALKRVNDELSRQKQFEDEQMKRSQDMKQAFISGDYISAAMLRQNMKFAQVQFQKENEIRALEERARQLQDRVKELEQGAKPTKSEISLINPKTKKAFGGFVSGPGTSTSDSIPALLSDGEYVIKASSVNKLGVDFLDFVNKNGKIPGFAAGGWAYYDPKSGSVSKSSASTRKSASATMPKAAPEKFDWGKSYLNSITKTNENNMPLSVVRTEGGQIANDIIDSVKNIGSGKGDILDGLSIALAPLAFTGLSGAPSKVASVAKRAIGKIDEVVAQKFIESTLKNPRVAIGMTGRGIEKTIQDKKVKNMFEVLESGLDVTRKYGYLDERTLAEKAVLGIPRRAEGKNRPTYGAITSMFGASLPYTLVQKMPGLTGDALRMFDPRFNRVMKQYSTDLDRSSRVTQGLAITKPGLRGTFSMGDSFGLDPLSNTFGKDATNKLFTLGSRSDAKVAAKAAIADFRSPNSTLKDLGKLSAPYLEAQISAKTNPFSFIKKFEVPIQSNDKSLYLNKTSAKTKSKELKEFLINSGAGNIKTGTVRNLKPQWQWELAQKMLKVRNSGPGRAYTNAKYSLKQILEGARRVSKGDNYSPKFTGKSIFDDELAMGGIVKPAYMRMGGLLPYKAGGGSIFKPLGSDTVSAMLTPGEFVVSRPAVNSFGVDRLRAINEGSYSEGSSSVYNINMTINAKDANAQDVAKLVMKEINNIQIKNNKSNRVG